MKMKTKTIDQDDTDATPFWDGIGGKGEVKDEPSVNRFEAVIYMIIIIIIIFLIHIL